MARRRQAPIVAGSIATTFAPAGATRFLNHARKCKIRRVFPVIANLHERGAWAGKRREKAIRALVQVCAAMLAREPQRIMVQTVEARRMASALLFFTSNAVASQAGLAGLPPSATSFSWWRQDLNQFLSEPALAELPEGVVWARAEARIEKPG